jgi:hypothetical protein
MRSPSSPLFPCRSRPCRARARSACRAGIALAVGLALPGAGAVEAGAGFDVELAASPVATRIGAPLAWSRGTEGRGVVVGLVDSGVLASHRDLAGRVMRGFNALDGGTDTGDALGHGTHVAGLLAAARDGQGIVGVSPDVRVLPVRVFDSGGASDSVLSSGIRWAAARSGVLNLSLASGSPIAGPALRDAVSGGALVVVAAGNRGAAHPDWPARYAREPWANGSAVPGAVIAVGAVDASNRIAGFSNRAGDAAAYFLVAPGVDVLSAWGDGDSGYARLSGTSMAAPAVSGAAALLKAHWPRLTGAQVASILLSTARDLGARGTDPVYGRGLLDVDAAMRPVGALQTATASGAVSLASTGLRLSPGTVAIGQATSAAGLAVVGVDAYRRDFATELSGRIADPLPIRLDQVFDAIDRRLERVERTLVGGTRLALQPGDSFAMVTRDTAGEFAIGAGGQAREYFGIAAGLDVAALSNPYASLAPRGAMLARGLNLGDTTQKAGVLSGASTETSGFGWTQVEARTVVLEASRRVADRFGFAATWTSTSEQGAWLGAIGSGGFALGQRVETEALQLGGTWSATPRTVLAATWAIGRTPAVRGEGLIGVSETRSDALSIALVRTDAILPGDGLSFALSQPMRTRAGEATAHVQTGVDAQGDPELSARRWSMVPSGHELLAEIAWRAELGRDRQISGALGWRRQPDHDASAAPDTLVALRYRQRF